MLTTTCELPASDAFYGKDGRRSRHIGEVTEEKSWSTWKSIQNIVMDEELVQKIVMDEELVPNVVMGTVKKS